MLGLAPRQRRIKRFVASVPCSVPLSDHFIALLLGALSVTQLCQQIHRATIRLSYSRLEDSSYPNFDRKQYPLDSDQLTKIVERRRRMSESPNATSAR